MSATILRGDARHLPLPDESVDLLVTSPPYWSLRSYTDGGEQYAGQIGAEPTPREYVAALLECTREWMRVLKPTGSMWVNLGDKYNSAASGQNGSHPHLLRRPRKDKVMERGTTTNAAPVKSLLGLPWRYALGCIDDLGLILRAEVIWSKPNGLPESVTDRVRRSHEQWFHLVKSPRYFSAVDEIREAHIYPNDINRPRAAKVHLDRAKYTQGGGGNAGNSSGGNPLGKLPGSVWEIATQPLKVPAELEVDHFAAFPLEWPRRIILGWSPSGICTACGEGRRPIVGGGDFDSKILQRRGVASKRYSERTQSGGIASPKLQVNLSGPEKQRYRDPYRITGYACACPEPTAPIRPAVVLDPFGGTGTVSLVADALGRHGISVDRSADYCRLAAWRTADPGERARVLGKPKPPKPMDGQGDLFEVAS